MIPFKFAKVFTKIAQFMGGPEKINLPGSSPSGDPLKEKADTIEAKILEKLKRKFENAEALLEKAKRRHNIGEGSSSGNRLSALKDIDDELSNPKKKPTWLMGAVPRSRSEQLQETKDLKKQRYPWDISMEGKDLPDEALLEAFSVTDFEDAENWAQKHKRTLGSLQYILKAPYLLESDTSEEYINEHYGLARYNKYTKLLLSTGYKPETKHFTRLLTNLNPVINEWVKNNIHYDKITSSSEGLIKEAGACDVGFYAPGSTSPDQIKEMFNQRRQELISMYGRGDGYTGDYRSVDSIKFANVVFDSEQEAEDYCLDKAGKSELLAVRFKDGEELKWLVMGWAAE